MDVRGFERIVWRWVLVLAILASAYAVAVSNRYKVEKCIANYCVLVDHWTGKLTMRKIDARGVLNH